MDRRTVLSARVITGQYQNSSDLLPPGRHLPDPKLVPGELLSRRPGRKCGSMLSLFHRNTLQSLPRSDQTYDWPLNCFSPEAPEPSWPEEEDQLGAMGATGAPGDCERRGENDDPPATEERSPSRRDINIRTWRRIEAKLGENDEELVLIVKGIPRESDIVAESSGPASKRMRIIFVE